MNIREQSGGIKEFGKRYHKIDSVFCFIGLTSFFVFLHDLFKVCLYRYTSVLWNNLRADSITKKIAYLLVWRNAHLGHFYAPYPGHSSVPDFIKFYNDPNSLFEKDLPDMYKVGY